MSFLEPEADKELERGPWIFDVLAVLFIPMGISRIGPMEAVPESASGGAIIGLVIVAVGFVAALIYSIRTKSGPDEWVARNQQVACAVAVMAALVADIIWSLASSGHLIRPMSANDLLGVQLITFAASWLWLRWRG